MYNSLCAINDNKYIALKKRGEVAESGLRRTPGKRVGVTASLVRIQSSPPLYFWLC